MPFRLALTLMLITAPALLLGQEKRKTSSTWFPAYPVGVHQESLPMDERPPMIMVAPLFIQTDQISSSIVLVNNSELNAGAAISVLNRSGAEIAHLHTVLSPHQQKELPLSEMLAKVSQPPAMGSIVVAQDHTLKGMTIAAQLIITDERAATPSYIDEELAMPSIDGSNMLRAVTDDSQGNALIAVTNTEDASQELAFRCLGVKGRKSATSISVQAHATVFLNGCVAESVASLSTYLRSLDQASNHNIEGIEISGDGAPGSLVAFALAPHTRANKILFSGIPFSDPALLRSPNFVFAGVPVGTQPTLPDGVYVPRISLTNFSSLPAHISISTADSVEMDGARAESGAASSLQKIRDLTIAPAQSVEVVMSGANPESGLLHSVRVTSDRKPGEVMGKLVSRSDGNLFQVELLGKDEQDKNNAGMHPWSVEGDAESHLLLFNHSASEQTFDVAIHNEIGAWDKKYKVAPNQTREISFNQIISENLKDDQGRVLSPDYHRGTVNWMVPDSGEATGRLMVTSHSAMMARNYSCGNFIVVCGFFVNTYDNDFIFINYTTPGFSADPQFCDEFSPSQCSGGSSTGYGSATYSSTVSPSSIIRFNTPADATSQSPNLFGVGAGTGSAWIGATAGSCSAGGYPTPPPTVGSPTQMLWFSDLTTKSQQCLLQSQNAVERVIQFQVTSTNGTPTPGVSVKEDFSSSPPISTCTTSAPTPTPCGALGSQAIITDVISTNACSPPNAATCGFTISPDHWELCNGTVLGSPKYQAFWQAVYVNDLLTQVPLGNPVPK